MPSDKYYDEYYSSIDDAKNKMRQQNKQTLMKKILNNVR